MGGVCARHLSKAHRANWDKVEAREKRILLGEVADTSNGREIGDYDASRKPSPWLLIALPERSFDCPRARSHMARIWRRSAKVIAWFGDPLDDIINSIHGLDATSATTAVPSMKKKNGGGTRVEQKIA